MRRSRLFICLLAVLIAAFSISAFPESWHTVSRVIDGDTLQLETGERVRLIGVDTPETVHPSKPVQPYGKEASAFTKKMAEGKKIRLEFDVQERDRYGRLLAYVYLEDGAHLNAELIRQGYAQILTIPPNVGHADEVRKLQQEAREANRGLWALSKNTSSDLPAPEISSDSKGETIVYVTRTGKKYHRDGCRSLSKSKIPLSLKEAAARYEPCSVCSPPTANAPAESSPNSLTSSATVYVTKTGTKYHREGCRTLRGNAIPMPLEEAKARYSPCSVCKPE